MSEPSEKEMLEYLDGAKHYFTHEGMKKDFEIDKAIRRLIEKFYGEWLPLARTIMDEDDMREVCSDDVCILARKIRDFGKEEGK